MCKKACAYDDSFRQYIKDCAFLNEYYIETRYPAEDPLIADKEDVEEGMKITVNIVQNVKTLVTKSEK